MAKKSEKISPVGYAALLKLFPIKAIPHFRSSYILEPGLLKQLDDSYYYPKKYFKKEFHDPFAQLEFALKHEGLNLEILSQVFKFLEPSAVETYVAAHPNSKIARKLWFLYEFLSGQQLNLPDVAGGNYIPLLDAKIYYVGPSQRSRRHYVLNNLLGTAAFCPLVRRTEKLDQFEEKDLSEVAKGLMEQFDPKIIASAVNYLYFKETMSSYEIEREKPDPSRAERFVEALKKADHLGSLTEELLVQLQNLIVDPRFANKGYRHFQNYIGTEVRLDTYATSVIYVSPKSEDVGSLMKGLLDTLERMKTGQVHPVIMAAAISFAFVFIHPFEDGNGRLHRFLIHYIFTLTGFVPKGAIFPVSAVMLKNMAAYNAVLESFSKPLMELLDYSLTPKGELTVKNESAHFYRFPDFTRFAEYLFGCVEKTIQTDFKNELQYIVNYDRIKRAIQNIVDMPDKKIHLFIQFVLQNQGRLSAKKRESHFSMLTDSEVERLEALVREAL